MSAQLNPDSRRIVAAGQGLRGAGYACTSVLLGALAARDYSASLAGVTLG